MTKMYFGLLALLSALLLMACEPAYVATQAPPPARPQATPRPPDGGSGRGSFSPNNLIQVPPSSILQEVVYYPTGGMEYCLEAFNQPTAISYPQEVEVLKSAHILTCGWNPGESIAITVQYPDGQSEYYTGTASQEGYPGYLHSFVLTQSGTYTFIFQGSNYRITLPISAYFPNSARMYDYGNRLVLYSLTPNETVSLFAYWLDMQNGLLKFVGWQTFQADSDGFLSIEVTDHSLVYYAYGESAGLIKNGNSSVSAESIFK